MNRKGAIFLVLLVVLSLLGGRIDHGAAHDCPGAAQATVSHDHHALSSAEAPSSGTIHDAAPAAVCNGLSCPMAGCCFPRAIGAAIGPPRTASSAMPLLLAVEASGMDPAALERPPRNLRIDHDPIISIQGDYS